MTNSRNLLDVEKDNLGPVGYTLPRTIHSTEQAYEWNITETQLKTN